MTYYLPSSGAIDSGRSDDASARQNDGREIMGDLKVFWGPEICRLEYLVHLLDTGRIKDDHWPRPA